MNIINNQSCHHRYPYLYLTSSTSRDRTHASIHNPFPPSFGAPSLFLGVKKNATLVQGYSLMGALWNGKVLPVTRRRRGGKGLVGSSLIKYHAQTQPTRNPVPLPYILSLVGEITGRISSQHTSSHSGASSFSDHLFLNLIHCKGTKPLA